MKLKVELKEKSYDIIIEKGSIGRVSDYVNLERKVMIITDDGVPKEYAEAVKAQCKEGFIHTVKQGEGAKSFPVFEELCCDLLSHSFSRKDLVVAVGGGVVGDLAGFVAASYMRGIDFVNIPTTTLSQIDSSIGGKVAINLEGVKNIIGAFYQPKCVIVDSDTLKTLPLRHFNNGLVEAVKAGMIYDRELFSIFEKADVKESLDEIITRSLMVKKDVVEKDEKEQSLRKILNFGHTIGHGVESYYNLSGLYHGEAVAVGMMPMTAPDLRERLSNVFKKIDINAFMPYDKEEVEKLVAKDKKAGNGRVTIVTVDEIGKANLKEIDLFEIKAYLKG